MKTITKIIKFLEIPDDQGKNWYAWAANQLSHTMIGAISAGITLMIYDDIWWAVIGAFSFAILKEITDLLRKPKTWKDSVDDISFQMAGVQFCVAIYNHYWMLFFWSICYGGILLWIGVHRRIKNYI
jgi:hypothetical protein